MLEIHYDNPKAKRGKFIYFILLSTVYYQHFNDVCSNIVNKFYFLLLQIIFTVVDHSGFRIHYTRHLRKEDGGMMISGVSVSDTQLIPPQQKLYRNVGICGPSCTSTVSFPSYIFIKIFVLLIYKLYNEKSNKIEINFYLFNFI